MRGKQEGGREKEWIEVDDEEEGVNSLYATEKCNSFPMCH